MIASNSDKRGFFKGLANAAKGAKNAVMSLFGKGKPSPKMKKAAEQAKLTGRPPKLPMKLIAPRPPKITQWKSKLLSWDWRQFIKGYKFEGKDAISFLVNIMI